MMQYIDDQMLKSLEQLTEADPMQFMQKLDELESKDVIQAQHRLLQYFKARALITMNRYSEAEPLALKLLNQAVLDRDHLMVARCNLILAKCSGAANAKDSKKSFLEVALEAAKNAREKRMIAEVLLHLGVYYQENNDKTNALNQYSKAKRLCAGLKDSDLELQLLIGYGNIFYKSGEHHKALAYMTDALSLAIECEDISRQLLILNNLSTLYSILLRFNDALEVLNRGIKIAEAHQIHMRKILLLFNIGVLHLKQDQYQQSYNKLKECEDFAATIGFSDPRYQLELYSNIAGACRYLESYDEAQQYLEQAISIAASMRDETMVKEMEVNKANLLLKMGKGDDAKKLLRTCRNYFRKHGKYEKMIVSQMNLAEYYEQKGDYLRCIALLKEISPLYQEYIGKILDQKAAEYHHELQHHISRFDRVKEDYGRLASQLIQQVRGEFIGQSPQHRKVLETAMLAAQHPSASVLLTGESGTGKEVIANLIHINGVRSSGPFIAVNVSAISSSLLESEFFGHRKGSFTGAIADHKGYFQQANHGTLFLDEIGDMPKDLQSKLLRVLESRRVTPVGSATEIPIDCRVICSTNRNLEEMLSSNLFRLDLFHRLNTIEIDIPPLRKRREDIPLLVDHFALILARQNKLKKPLISRAFMARMQSYSFPGNVRELRNMIERLFILLPNRNWDEELISSLPFADPDHCLIIEDKISIQSEIEQIISALERCAGKQKEASLLLNLSESTLSRRIKKHGLEIYTRKGR